MSVPFPVGLISSGGPLLTKVVFTVNTGDEGLIGYSTTPGDAGLEDQTDADGGTNVADFVSIGSDQYEADLSGLNILWDDRYNYRIGAANLYSLEGIDLYKDGVLEETNLSGGSTKHGLRDREHHCGYNLDPSNRNGTRNATASGVGYPKSGD